MIDFEREELLENPLWRRVLEVYQADQKTAADADGWIARVRSVAGIDPEQLSRIHGKLIALGLLKFQITGREVGMCYQLSTLGRNLLAGVAAGADELAGVADEG